MQITRRNLIRSGLAAAAVTGILRPVPALAVAASGTTLARTWQRGPAGTGGYRKVVAGPGEPHVVRAEFVATPTADRAARRSGVLAFAQLSDVHIVDAQSPMRLEWVDRFDDTDIDGDPTTGLASSAYRAHEMLSTQVADAMVRAINEVAAAAPVTGLPLALAIQTGDNADNAQYNETRWNIAVLSGGTVLTPDSGNRTRWEGVADQDLLSYDLHYWHPDGQPLLRPVDIPRKEYGFPVVPGLLDAARRPFTPVGLRMPWFTAFGNHDGGVQGNFPPGTLGAGMSAIATGSLKIISPPSGLSQADLLHALRTDPLGLLNNLLGTLELGTHVRLVSPDPDRRILTRRQIVEEHFTTTGTPVGHGFTEANRADGTAYYTFVRGDVQFLVLDTVNPNGYSNGSIDQPQMDWLAAELAAPRAAYQIVCSHHTSETMDNPLIVTGGDPNPRVQGPAVVALLQEHPRVIAWINGHSHRNQIWARPGGKRGFWEINTASHVDFPQQSRLLEIADNGDGTLSLFCTMVDHAAGTWSGSLANTVQLAALARELSANDWQEHTTNRSGEPTDRNVELLIQKP
ncbi:TIGR03767 family metallophosphoesterase [Nocardioides jiangxiensis]|uniref:TIGR03767 family metallophosphoesterase n=1 Tax=Nocardioides jiangxiensis TaxID=3064524 RepID=A0ABT9AYA3_9ACTN|nr:TIGR03767 family metallophosphoesterase [Nocardioides sp. WY-20]MDO7866893.1 TIGR03767 family metallophosphoesterase [Nocardioides sp. WY-20]